MPDKWPSAKSLFAVKFFSEGSLPRAALGKTFAEGFWAFAECPGPSAKRAPPVVNGALVIQHERINKLLVSRHDIEFDPR